MFLNKICTIVKKATEVPGGHFWECRENSCRFQINGRCAILASYDLAARTSEELSRVAKELSVKN